MRKWGLGAFVLALLCLPLFSLRSASPDLLTDSDTAVALQAIRARQAPLSWFGGDWPLENHFYRPVSTLFFEFDNAISGGNPAGYGWTNLLLVLGSVFALFWLLREISNSVPLSVGGAAVFAVFSADLLLEAPWLSYLCFVPFAALLLGGRSLKRALLASSAWLILGYMLTSAFPLAFRMIQWVPGRTASTMTLFLLLGLACFARYVRLAHAPAAKPATALDLPATKGTAQTTPLRKPIWLVLGTFATLLALGCYEQAVVLPFLCVGLAIFWLVQGRRDFKPVALATATTILYASVRMIVLPTAASGYQSQQFRSGPGVWLSLGDYLIPGLCGSVGQIRSWVGPSTLLLPSFYAPFLVLAAFMTVAYVTVQEVKRGQADACLALLGYGLSAIAFAPMAFLKHFDHYHFAPLAFRGIAAAGLAAMALRLTVSAATRPARQAPPRPHPAPGSLLHP